MKTYPADILRQALVKLIDFKKYHRFTIYRHKKRPLKIKGKICGIWCTPNEGIKINFNKVYFNRRRIGIEISIPVRDIRWAETPFSQKAFEELCRELTPKLTP